MLAHRQQNLAHLLPCSEYFSDIIDNNIVYAFMIHAANLTPLKVAEAIIVGCVQLVGIDLDNIVNDRVESARNIGITW